MLLRLNPEESAEKDILNKRLEIESLKVQDLQLQMQSKDKMIEDLKMQVE